MNLVLFTSKDAHYSILKWGNVCDVKVVLIETDKHGRMDVNDLRANIIEEQEKGNYPISVIATAGMLRGHYQKIMLGNDFTLLMITFMFRNNSLRCF